MKLNRFLIIVLVLLAGLTGWAKPAMAVQTFTDMKGHWAQEAVMTSASCDMIKGYPDQSFRPDQQLTQLEALVLFMKSQGYVLDQKTTTAKSKTPRNPAIPLIPWGQSYLDTAYETYLLPQVWASNFQYDAPATRAQVAILLGRLLNLTSEGESWPAAGQAGFSDLGSLSQETRGYIYALNDKGIIFGYPNGRFMPQQPLKRGEAAALLLKLMEGSWAKMEQGRLLEGWVKSISPAGNKPELVLASLQGDQTLKLDSYIKCFQNGQECYSLESLNSLVKIYLDSKKQVSVISIQERKKSDDSPDTLIASVKSVELGATNILVLSKLNDSVVRLPLAWEATLESLKSQAKGFTTLKAGTFVKVYISDGEAVRVTELKTLKVSGTVMSISDSAMKLDEKAAKNGQTNRFTDWRNARMTDKDGKKISKIIRGDKVEVTYYDPDAEKSGDEIPLAIIMSSRPELKKVAGVVQDVSSSIITVEKDKEYDVDDAVKVYEGEGGGTRLRLKDLEAGDKIEMYVDGAGMVMKVIRTQAAAAA